MVVIASQGMEAAHHVVGRNSTLLFGLQNRRLRSVPENNSSHAAGEATIGQELPNQPLGRSRPPRRVNPPGPFSYLRNLFSLAAITEKDLSNL